MDKVCSVEGCGGKHYAKGLCRKHYMVERYVANAEAIRQSRAEYCAANAETVRQTYAKYRRTSKGIAAKLNSRAKKRGIPGPGVTPEHVEKLLGVAECPYCGTPITEDNREYDHVISAHKGGTQDDSNVSVLCRTCNQVKAHLSHDEFFDRIRRILAYNHK
jgi:5-methylcytosine-specific restriction endonuclease McrA